MSLFVLGAAHRRPILHERRPTPHLDALWDCLGGNALATWNGKRGTGGEWDALRSVPLKRRRRLTGAGYLRRDGMAPDQLAELIRTYGPAGSASWGTCECIDWYVRTALRALDERRTAHHYDRHLAYAKACGKRSYYALRDAAAQEAGYSSLWQYRKAMGWT